MPRATPRRMMRHPALHFLALGGLLFLARERLATSADETVVIAPERVAELRADFARQNGRPPAPAEEARLLDELAEEELLLVEARRSGLDRGDLVIFRRLAHKMRVLAEDPDRPVGELYAQAKALGLDRDDPIVRRRLVQKMRLRLAAEAGPVRATPEEIAAFYAAHRERFLEPARVRLSHVFLSRARYGDALEPAAEALLAELRRDRVAPENAVARGEPFLLGHHLPWRTRATLQRGFGADFAEQAFAFAPGSWGGVASSPYGLHLVWVHERRAAKPAPLDDVRDQVLRALAEEQRRDRLATSIADLRRRLPVRIERTEVG